MVTRAVEVNNHSYTITLSDQTTMLVTRLKRLYNASYGDVESFDETSGAISTTINELIKHTIEPDPGDEDLDGVIQALLRIFEEENAKS